MTIAGTGLGATRAATTTLLPPPPLSVLLENANPSGTAALLTLIDTIPSGTTTFARVRIEAPAGAGGLVLTMASNNPSTATVPLTVTVPPGDSVARFAAQGASVGQTVSTFISASVSAVSKSATVFVRGASLIAVSALPSRVVGRQSLQATVSLDRAAPTRVPAGAQRLDRSTFVALARGTRCTRERCLRGR